MPTQTSLPTGGNVLYGTSIKTCGGVAQVYGSRTIPVRQRLQEFSEAPPYGLPPGTPETVYVLGILPLVLSLYIENLPQSSTTQSLLSKGARNVSTDIPLSEMCAKVPAKLVGAKDNNGLQDSVSAKTLLG